jgi:hypothetical protein
VGLLLKALAELAGSQCVDDRKAATAALSEAKEILKKALRQFPDRDEIIECQPLLADVEDTLGCLGSE